MKVLVTTHQAAFNIHGGAEIQIKKTVESLSALGVQVRLFNMWEDRIDDFDILHIFNPTMFPYESYFLAKYAKDTKPTIKVAVSPIFWVPYYSHGRIKKSVVLNMGKLAIALGRIIPYFGPRYVKKVLELSDVILPNTTEEQNLVKSLFRLKNKNAKIVPNGVDEEFKYGDPKLFEEKYGIRDFILFVGRIERRKNVLRLIEAFNESGLDTHLVIIGSVFDREYYLKCKEKAGDRVLFLPPLPHNSDMLKSAYKAAKVVALPSYYETPGLVALEGGLAGANIVITPEGGTKEYFRDYAWYVDPLDKESIKTALISAFEAPRRRELSKYIEENFTWKKIGERMVRIYKELLEG